jgi:ABC-type sugar transport system ATPase subunit
LTAVTLRNVAKRYGALQVINDVSLDVHSGEFVVFVGPSGCGKSTLLRMIAGLEPISVGELSIDGQVVNNVAARDRGIAMVFQSYALYPHMTVAENMEFGLTNVGTPKAEIASRVAAAAETLQITHLLQRRPKDMSGGQRQRVAIGRAIVRQPRVFLFDEPLSNLDAALRVQMRTELAKLHRKLGATMIYVTHDQTEAMTMADRIVVLRAGIIEQVGTPIELYEQPENSFVAGFLGSPKMNLVKGKVASLEAGKAAVTIGTSGSLSGFCKPGTLAPGDDVTIGIRPEHLRPVPGDGDLVGVVEVVENLGNLSLVYVALASGETVVCETRGKGPAPGESVGLRAAAGAVHVFDSHGTSVVDHARKSVAMEGSV